MMISNQATDPLEDALAEWAALWQREASRNLFKDALDTIRVLKRGHTKVNFERALPEPFCFCGSSWPCPVLAEAAKTLRG